VIPNDWPSLPDSMSTKRDSTQGAAKGAKSAMNTPQKEGFQNSNEFQCRERAGPSGTTQQQGSIPTRVMIVNGRSRAWFYSSKGLNDLFSRAGKIVSPNTKPSLVPNPRPKPLQENPLDSQRRRSYVEVLTMAFGGDGSGKGQEPGRGTDGGQGHGADDKDRNTVVNGGSAEGRGNFNLAGRYNPGHERDRSYGGYATG
jgi:hypothetical protein